MRKLKTRHLTFLLLVATMLLTLPPALAAEGDQNGREGAAEPSLIKLGVHDSSGELVARLILQEGQRGSIYFEETPKGLGIVPELTGDDEVRLLVYDVERVSDREESLELKQVLTGVSPAKEKRTRQVEMQKVGPLKVTLLGIKHTPSGRG